MAHAEVAQVGHELARAAEVQVRAQLEPVGTPELRHGYRLGGVCGALLLTSVSSRSRAASSGVSCPGSSCQVQLPFALPGVLSLASEPRPSTSCAGIRARRAGW